MTAVYHAIDNANRRPQNKAEFLSDKKINELKENKFVRINKISETEDDEKKLVMYTEYPHGKPKDETQNNIVAAVQGESYRSRGRKSTVYESVWDRIVRGIGFNSVNKAWENDERRIIQTRGREKLKREKQRAIDKYLANPTFENAAKLKELGIKKKTVEDERKRKEIDSRERLETSMTKRELEEHKKLTEFLK